MKKILLTLGAICLTYSAQAQEMLGSESQSLDETVVFGEANNPDGTKTDYILEQGADEGNPLGEPIATTPTPVEKKVKPTKATMPHSEPEVIELQPMESNAWAPELDEIPADRPNGNPQGNFLPTRTYESPMGESVVEPKVY